MKRRFGLKPRFISLILAVVLLIFGTVAAITVRANAQNMRKDLQERALAFSALATKPIGNTYLTYQDSGTTLIGQQMDNFSKLDRIVSNISVIGLDGNIKYSQRPGAVTVSEKTAESFEPTYEYTKSGAISRIIYPYIEDGGRHSYGIVYDISSKSVDDAVAIIVKNITIYAILGVITSAALMYLIVNRVFLDPIKYVRDRALVISGGNYSEQLALGRNDEIGDLAVSVNEMANNLKADIQKLKEVDQVKTEFMMIASHNLRTPIGIIKGYLELIGSQELSDDTKNIVKKIQANSERLSLFTEDILVISSIESGMDIFTKEPTPVDRLFGETLTEFQTLAEEKKINFVTDIEQTGMTISAHLIHLRSAVWNLLENALKFSNEGGEIKLSLRHVGTHIELTIVDHGIGISSEEVTKLFTKFHRGTSTEEYNYEGTGIGLYITKLVVSAHDGDITVSSILGQGSTFTVTLPVIVPTPPAPAVEAAKPAQAALAPRSMG